MTQYWLIKTEPEDYSIEAFEKDKSTIWTGVRNYAARNHLSMMQPGDRCLFYRSVVKPAVVGLARVSKSFFQDPTTDDKAWVSVELTYEATLSRPVTLTEIKKTPGLEKMTLLRISRLSVQPVTASEFDLILAMSETIPDKDGK